MQSFILATLRDPLKPLCILFGDMYDTFWNNDKIKHFLCGCKVEDFEKPISPTTKVGGQWQLWSEMAESQVPWQWVPHIFWWLILKKNTSILQSNKSCHSYFIYTWFYLITYLQLLPSPWHTGVEIHRNTIIIIIYYIIIIIIIYTELHIIYNWLWSHGISHQLLGYSLFSSYLCSLYSALCSNKGTEHPSPQMRSLWRDFWNIFF